VIIKYKTLIFLGVLGIKLGLLLVLAVIFPMTILQSFGDPSISVDFDKSEYQTGEVAKVSGHVSEVSMPVIAVSVYDPNGKILSANNVEIDEENNFSKEISLESPFYDEPGEYKVKLDYAKVTKEEYFIIEGEELESEISLDELLAPEIILLHTDKPIYTDGDTITVTGVVSSVDSPSVLVGVYDTFGTPAGFYFGEINSDMEFSVSFLAKSDVNFKQDGTYSIKAHYAESEETTFFDFYANLDDDFFEEKPEEKQNENKQQEQNSNSKSKSEDKETKSNKKEEKSNEKETKENKSNENNKSIIKDTKQNESPKKQNEPIQENKEKTKKENKDKKWPDAKFTKTKNLSVDDIELGLMLNQINLECDSRSTYIDTISYYDGMGPALYRLCKFSSSVTLFDETLAKDPKNVEVITNKGSALGKLGRTLDAIKEYDKALEINPNFVPALNNKANSLATLGKYDEAISLYLKALQVNPDYTTAKKNFAITLSHMPMEEDFESNTSTSVEEFNEVSRISSIPQIEPPIDKPKEDGPKENPNFLEALSSVLSSFLGFFG